MMGSITTINQMLILWNVISIVACNKQIYHTPFSCTFCGQLCIWYTCVFYWCTFGSSSPYTLHETVMSYHKCPMYISTALWWSEPDTCIPLFVLNSIMIQSHYISPKILIEVKVAFGRGKLMCCMNLYWSWRIAFAESMVIWQVWKGVGCDLTDVVYYWSHRPSICHKS